MLANLVCSLILHKRVTTTISKARAARSVAEKMVTLGKGGTLHDRRLAAARLHREDAVKVLFNEIAPTQKERRGGYTRIVRLGNRQGDAAQKAILEFVDIPVTPAPAEKASEKGAEKAAEKGSEKPAEKAKTQETKPATAAS